jgi:hypothetical protein
MPEGTNAISNSAAEQMVDARDDAEFDGLQRSLELGLEKGWDFRLADIERVESMWRLLDGDATAYGFVVKLREGRRVYFDYDIHTEDGTLVEHATMQPMGDELHPRLDGTIPGWDDQVGALNRHFAN